MLAYPEFRKLVLSAVNDDYNHQCIDYTTHFVLDRIFWVGIWKNIKEYYIIYRSFSMSIDLMNFTTVEKSASDIENIQVLTDMFTKHVVPIQTCNQKR